MNKDNIMFTILVTIIIIILVTLILLLLYKYSYIIDKEKGMKSYNVEMPAKDEGKNMIHCLKGCVRGTCKNNGLDGSCKYDFQCQYCQDMKTNMFYVNFDNERKIVPLYEEEDKLNYNQQLKLNDSINKNNNYISELNKKIILFNS